MTKRSKGKIKLLTFCLIGVKVARKREVNDLAEEKKLVVENEDGDEAEINLQNQKPAVDENIPEENSRQVRLFVL